MFQFLVLNWIFLGGEITITITFKWCRESAKKKEIIKGEIPFKYKAYIGFQCN